MITRRTTFGLAASLATLSAALPAALRAQEGLGLADRRALAAFRQDKWPAIETGIHEAAGFPVPVQVEWEQLAKPGDGQYYGHDDYFVKTIFQPLTAALRSITGDAMGRDALRAKLQRINVRFDEKTAPASNYPNGLAFRDGVLDMNWRPFSNAADVEDRTKAITQLLEKSL